MTSRTDTPFPQSRPAALARRLSQGAAIGLVAGCLLAAGGSYSEVRAATPESQQFLEDARKRMEAGDGNAAVIQLRNALQADPQNVEARLLLGQLYLGSGQFDAAEKELARYGEAKPEDEEAGLLLARARFGLSDFEGALAALPQDPSDDDVAYRTDLVRAETLLALGEAERAAALVEDLRSRRLTDVRVSIIGARAALARRLTEDAERFAREATETDPDFAPAWLVRAQVALSQQKLDDAAGYAERAGSLAPGSTSPSLLGAELDLRRGRLDEAEATIDGLLETAPQAVEPRYLKAAVLAARRDFEGAERLLDQLAEPLKDYQPAQFLTAMVKYQVGRHAQARTQIERYLASDPDNLAAQRLLAATLLRSDNPHRAAEVLARMSTQAPDDPGTLRLLATAQMRAGDFSGAAETLRSLTETSSGATAAQARSLAAVLQGDSQDIQVEGQQLANSVALILNDLQLGDLGPAESGARELVEAHPDNPVTRNTLAGVLLVLGKDEEARSELQRALEIDGDFRAAHENLDRLDSRAGDFEAIEERWTAYLERNPHDPWGTLRYASFLNSRDRAQEAQALLDRAVTARPENPDLLAGAVNLALRIGDDEVAAAKAEQLAERLPEDAQAQTEAGRVLLQLQKFEAASERLTRARELAPDNQRALELLIQARIGAKDSAGAEAAAQALVQERPDSYLANRILVDLYTADGKDAELEALLTQAGQLDGELHARLRARAAVRKGEPGVAADILEEIGEPSAAAVEERFAARLQAGDPERAKDLLKRWVSANPQAVGPAILLANQLMVEEAYEEAEAILTAALPAASRNPVLLNNLAWLRSTTDKAGAEALARRALGIAPDSPAVADTLGWILVQRGELAEGEALLRQASVGAPDDASIAYHLAYTLVQRGQSADAIPILEQVAEAGSASAEDARELLGVIREKSAN